eukprot:2270522-Amphidinium_carterae.1
MCSALRVDKTPGTLVAHDWSMWMLCLGKTAVPNVVNTELQEMMDLNVVCVTCYSRSGARTQHMGCAFTLWMASSEYFRGGWSHVF